MLGWASDRARAAAKAVKASASRTPARTVHLLVAVCDHFEPLWSGERGKAGEGSLAQGIARVAAWRRRYPELAAEFRDADGRPPRHTFFFPGEQYNERLLEPLAELCAEGLGEVEMHLHHADDTRSSLARSLQRALRAYDAHGLVPKVGASLRWSFIHGNWCLANGRRDGAHCGVDDEIELLYELGCYADFTFPSAPDETQPGIVNAIYYPEGDVARRRAYARGRSVTVGTPGQARLLIVQGPLAIARREGRGVPFRIDSASLTARDPATPRRLRTWIAQGVHVHGRPEWVFIKLHTHGAPEHQAASLLGAPQRRFHEALAELRRRGDAFVHYVTAREMYNIARAAMDGQMGTPSAFRDYEIPPPKRAAV
jgi:hypothetical protein